MKKRAARRSMAEKKKTPPQGRARGEEIEIRAEDGATLRAVIDEPPEGGPMIGTLVFAHAMFARRTEWGRPDRPGLAAAWARRGWRTIAFDFRGHGESRFAGDFGYDDLVRFDLPAVASCARARGEGRPVAVVGHSLGGHVALASIGTRRLDVDGVVAIAANVWLRELEPSRAVWAVKLAASRALRAVVARAGGFPARALRLGSDDEPATYMRDLLRGALEGRWGSADGREDYLASLREVRVPVCAVASDGDRLNCRPPCAEALARRCGGPVEIVRVRRADDGGPAPGHMELVTGASAERQVTEAIAWIERATGAR